MNARMRICFLLLAVTVLGAAVKPGAAQEPPNVTDYINPATAYHTSNFDYIDPLNQRLALNIPLVVDHSQRGNLNFTYSLRYASTTAWYGVEKYDTFPYLQWQPPNDNVTGPFFSMDGNLGVGIAAEGINYAGDETGAQHFLGTLTGTQMSCNFTAESVDGSGIYAALGPNCSQGTRTVVNRQGVQFQNGEQIEDTNGNVMTFGGHPNVSQMTDTAGRIWSYSYGGGDTNICPVPAISADLWQVPGFNGSLRNFTFCYSLVQISTNFGDGSARDYNVPASLITAVVLPDGTSWQFSYDSYGDLTSVQLPTGGTVSYAWTGYNADTQPWCNIAGVGACQVRTLVSRTSNDGNTQSLWQYGNFTVTDPAGNDTVYTPANPNDVADDDRVNSIQYFTGTSGSGNLIKTIYYGYQTLNNPYPRDVAEPNPVPNQVTFLPTSTETQWPNGMASETAQTYDSGFTFTDDNDGTQYGSTYGLVTGGSTYDYGSSGPGATLSATQTQYKALSGDSNAPSYLSANLLNLVSSTTILDGGGHQAALTSYFYDENNGSPQCVCGNLTSVTRWLNVGGTSPKTQYVNNGYGMKTAMIDPNLNQTSYSYDSTGVFLSQIQHPSTNGTAHNEGFGYDSNTGVLLSYTDQNSQVTQYKNYDSMLRVGEIDYPDTGRTYFSYPSSTEIQMTQTISITPPANKVTTEFFDGLGRPIQTQVTSGQGTISTEQGYSVDSQHHTFLRTVSNPHYGTSSATDGTTTYSSDALGRVVTVTDPDGDTVAHSYIPDGTRFLDQQNDEAGDTTNTWYDALGRANQVNVFPNSVARTQYYYDALNNLTEVDESGSNYSNDRIRTFSYDSLSRLLSATNPESGTETYTYDANGNLRTKTVPQPNQTNPSVTTTISYCYDQLNRLETKSYSSQACSNYTNPSDWVWLYDDYIGPTGYFQYMTNPIGRLTAEGNNSSGNSADVFGYDAVGRVTFDGTELPHQGPNEFDIEQFYTYDLAGDRTSESIIGTNGGAISYSYDTDMRLMSVATNQVDTRHPASFTTVDPNFGYWPTGQVRMMTLGNGLAEASAYNNRLEPCRMNVNSSGTFFASCTDGVPNGNKQDFSYDYGGSWNNGNIWSWTATGTQNFNRSYSYDGTNELISMSAPGDSCSGLSWLYDPWGNRTDQNPTGGTCNPFHAIVNTNNQLVGYQYDAAGNLIYDGVHNYTYDLEHRLTAVDGDTTTYQYDAEGRRIETVKSGVWTDFYHGLDNHVTAEYTSAGYGNRYAYFGNRLLATYTSGTGGSTYFVHPDHLGSTRLMTTYSQTGGQNQQIYDSMDYLPFGEQIGGGSGTTHKFTGQERDSETGNDNFEFRYYGSSVGRFLSPDDPFVDQHIQEPQSWNLYSYVRNNPLRFTDPDGHNCTEDEDGNFSGDCSSPGDEQVTQSNISEQDTVFGQLDTSLVGDLSAFGLNFGFTLNNISNDYFGLITQAIGVQPSYMTNTPTGSGFIAKSAAVFGTAAGMVVGPEGEAGEAINISEKALQHVLDSHITGGALVDASKSLFSAGEDVKGLIQAAGTVTARSQGNVKVFIVDAGRIIGIDRNTGTATRIYTVITDNARNLITAHPGLP